MSIPDDVNCTPADPRYTDTEAPDSEITKILHDLIALLANKYGRQVGERSFVADLESLLGRTDAMPHYDGEICQDCGKPLGYVWCAPDWLWHKVMGGPGGVLCATCFSLRVESSWRSYEHVISDAASDAWGLAQNARATPEAWLGDIAHKIGNDLEHALGRTGAQP